jgi:hypothetical protein
MTPRVPAAAEITCPHAFISSMSLRFVAFNETVDIDFEVTVLVSHADNDTGWDTVSQLCDVGSGSSIIDALLDDPTLDGEVDGVKFVEIRNLGGVFDVGGVVYLAFQMAFIVHV